ncbi:MAG: hypothetical protein RL158_994 [Bacteroidota bacterium]|jgi:hypothetical protein
MADEQIKIRIQADAEQFKAVSAAVEKALADIGKQAEITQGKIKGMGDTVKKGNVQWTNLALIIQDLPYGFRGIQNNLPALASGMGAVYLAVSAVVAVITALDMGLISFGNKIKLSTDYNKKFAETLSEESIQLESLYRVATDNNKAMDDRLQAAKALKNEYPGLLKNYSEEDIALGKAKNAYADLTKEVLKYAKAQAASSKLKEIAAKQIDLEVKEGQLIAEQAAAKLSADKQQAQINKKNLIYAAGTLNLEAVRYSTIGDNLQKNRDQQKFLNDEAAKYTKILDENVTAQSKLKDFQTKPKEDKSAENRQKEAEKEMKRIMAAEEYLKNWQIKLNKDIADAQVAEGDRLRKEQEDARKQEIEDYTQRVQLFKSFYANKLQLAEGDRQAQKAILEQQMQDLVYFYETFGMYAGDVGDIFSDVYKKWVDNNKAITNEAMKSILQMGVGIMNALGPSLDLLLDKSASIGEVIGRAITDLIKKFIKLAIAAAAAVAIIAILNPAILKNAGGALKFFGNLVGQGMGLGSNLFGSAAGATATGTAANVSNSMPSSQPFNVNVTGKISGSDIALSNQRATSNNNVTF